jgi:hypothetical protein
LSKKEERGKRDEEDDDFKVECARYKKGRRGALFNPEARRSAVADHEELKEIMRIVH